MTDNSDSRESDNNSWVIAGSEALPVENLGLETQAESEPAQEDTQAPLSESKALIDHPDADGASQKMQGPEVVVGPSSEETAALVKTPEPVLSHAKEASTCEAEEGSVPVPQGTVVIHKAGPLGEEEGNNSSSGEEASKERDVEGLRRRKGRDAPPVLPGAGRDRGVEAFEGDEGGLPRTKWLFGFLALLGLALLVSLGVIFDQDDGSVDIFSPWSSSDSEEPIPGAVGVDWPASPPREPPVGEELQRAKEAVMSSDGDHQSLDAMGLLLDKLAKENQDIRLMQAELQAQKEELQLLLRKTEGEALDFTSQRQNLAAENSRLAEALKRETASLLATQAELHLLQEKLAEAGDSKSQPRPEKLPAQDRQREKAERPEVEIRRLRSLLASVRRDLGRAFQKVPPGNVSEGLWKELDGVEQRVAQELEGAEEGARPFWKEGHKAKRRKEKAWHRRHDGHEERKPTHHGEGPEEEHRPPHKAPKIANDGPHRPRKYQGPRDAKPAKDREHRKAKKPTEPGALWEALAKHPYRPPQGCAGVSECARQEGLEPVQKPRFLPMLQSYLAGLGWSEHYGGLVAALDGYFGSDGAFAHDRLSFVELLDEVEDTLEELAEQLGGSEEEADNFEEVMLRQLGAAPPGRFTQRDSSSQRHPKERNPEGHGRKNGRESTSWPHG
ncbi:pre-B-cell leukemia transcription factor-interacting protein 1 isoform X2 [Zootoca vivipara]|uniref:pre-B-cell leukemia transcription factor-interacting protein 1 isoform X2 n=1 Tax=Zootoca vivipara TaxID=8524 RepID=UPI00293BD888|nr:pre-B-cell leukemia transcription factor-interacting protein 1 isoform X2 [Zootoca vivipara]